MKTLGDAPAAPNNDPKLQSSFALLQLTAVAEKLERLPFVIMAMHAFSHLPIQALVELHVALRQGTVANPVHRVAELDGRLARYDSNSQSIDVDRSAIEAALSQSQGSCALLAAMINAFGHYVDDVLSRQSGVESGDHADHYYKIVAVFDDGVRDAVQFGAYSSLALTGELLLEMPDAIEYFSLVQDQEGLPHPASFSAGRGEGTPHSFAHESIEDVLEGVGFSSDERKAIYFGNWLRDYSQLIDPKIVRPVDAPKNFPSKFSRLSLTQIVDMLALKQFHMLQTTREQRLAYTVDTAMVGVYRPSEHIDNPVSIEDSVDPQSIDAAFELKVVPGDACLRLDSERSLYPYIDDAIRYMTEKLLAAASEGRTAKGLRLFGEALHVLEDFFAHSNFVELSLRKVGHTSVLPWTVEKDCKHRWPLVTGKFGGSDIIASVAEPIARILFPTDGIVFKPTRPGDRSDSENMLLILLDEHENPEWKNTLTSFLSARDKLVESPYYEALAAGSFLITLPMQAVTLIANRVLQSILKWAGDSVDDLQTLLGDDPNVDGSLFPTHSQLAKDHDTHPLHGLAAMLASKAVEEVGRSMHEYWQGNESRDPASLALSFIRHAQDSDWQDPLVAAWAQDHAEEISQSSSTSELNALQKNAQKEALERVKQLGLDDNFTPISYREKLSGVFPFG
ncbi:HET-C-related protein [Pseudomonas plecoglossicida]|uniref:HET-C-related protein n=1 Tax=Pseudomonas plecoglossicida TaxID=70775 RepID=UPI00067CFC81|nr:HET-C-related protein [Pseudomonas plecoglossicida]GLR37634.1 hypothetical protein GCM10011247_30320 [Pseudomonas plecoglossicida]